MDGEPSRTENNTLRINSKGDSKEPLYLSQASSNCFRGFSSTFACPRAAAASMLLVRSERLINVMVVGVEKLYRQCSFFTGKIGLENIQYCHDRAKSYALHMNSVAC